jgi:uncharacterized protein involved in outer membrane biogenesis
MVPNSDSRMHLNPVKDPLSSDSFEFGLANLISPAAASIANLNKPMQCHVDLHLHLHRLLASAIGDAVSFTNVD